MADCPNGGIVRFGVEPYETAPKLTPIYEHIGKAIADKLGCEVKVYVATSYNAEIEAMRNGKLEIGEFGPLGYVLAHEVAKAEAVAAFSNKEGKPDSYWASIVRIRPPASKPLPKSRAVPSHFPIRPPPQDIFFRRSGCARPVSIPTRT